MPADLKPSGSLETPKTTDGPKTASAWQRPAIAQNSPLVERLERALVLAARIVLLHGPVYAPYIDRLEMELERARRNDPMERARRILEIYTVEGDENAIRLSQSRLCSKDGPTP